MIGKRIRTLREQSGMSQEELAHAVAMGKNTVARWEREELTPRGTSLAKIAKALHTTSAYLLGETNNVVLQEGITQGNPAPDNESMNEKRIIIKNNDMYVNLPETSEGFEALRRFFRMQEEKSGADVIHTLAQA